MTVSSLAAHGGGATSWTAEDALEEALDRVRGGEWVGEGLLVVNFSDVHQFEEMRWLVAQADEADLLALSALFSRLLTDRVLDL